MTIRSHQLKQLLITVALTFSVLFIMHLVRMYPSLLVSIPAQMRLFIVILKMDRILECHSGISIKG